MGEGIMSEEEKLTKQKMFQKVMEDQGEIV